MNKLGHIIVGYLTAILFTALMYFYFDWQIDIKEAVIIIILTYLFCLLPDIDHPLSAITWHFIGISILGLAVGYIAPAEINGTGLMVASFCLLAMTFVCARFLGHRGPVHTVWAGAVFAFLLYFIFWDFRFCLLSWVVFYSHLAADGYLFKV